MEQGNGIGQILLNIFKIIGFIIIASLPMQFIVTLINLQDKLPMAVNSILAIVCLLLIILIIIFAGNRYYKYSREKLKKIRWRDIGFAVLYFLFAQVIATISTLLIEFIYGDESTKNDQILLSLTDDSTFVLYFLLFVLSMGVFIPIVEELTYRGIAANLLFKKHRFWLPLIVTSLVFGSMHASTDIISFMMYVLMGTVFFLAYYRRKSILDSILVHIINNAIASISLAFDYFM